jgi:WD40 repeat protein
LLVERTILYRPTGSQPPAVTSISVDPSGLHLVCGTLDARIILLDAGTGKMQRVLKGHESMVSAVLFIDGGKRILSASWDKTTRVWTRAGVQGTHVLKQNDQVKALTVWEPSQRGAAGARDGEVRIFSTTSLRSLKSFRGHAADISGLSFVREGTQLVTASYDGECRLWDLRSSQMLSSLGKYNERIRSLGTMPDESRIFLGMHSGEIQSVGLDNPKDMRRFAGHSDVVTSLSVDPSGKYLLSGSMDRTVRLWSTESNSEKLSLKAEGGVSSVAWAASGEAFSSDFSGAVISWGQLGDSST